MCAWSYLPSNYSSHTVCQILDCSVSLLISEERVYNRLPAITICYPKYLAMNRVIEKYSHLRPVFEEYKNSLENVSNDQFYNKTFVKYLNDIYEEKFEKYIKNQSLSIDQLFQMSIPFEFARNSSFFASNTSEKSIDVKVYGLRLFNDNTISFDILKDIKPIEFISKYRKCFTFNNHLNTTIRQYKMIIEKIEIMV